MRFNFLYKKAAQGFSLIELIVAVSIIILISSVALFHQAQFSSDILIGNMAYDIALTIRQAEVFGISSKGNGDAASLQGTEEYRVGYGVHFAGDGSGSKPGSFLTFVDVPTGIASSLGQDTSFNYKFDANNSSGPTDLITSTIDLTQGEKIHRFCAHNGSGWNCWDSGPLKSDMALDIVFVKPNPDAHITVTKSSVVTGGYDQAKIVIESGLGDKCRTVRVWISGQVSVDAIDPNDTSLGCEPQSE